MFTVLAVFLLVVASIYRIQSLHRKKIWNLSIQQLIHLVLIPGVLFPMVFSYLLGVMRLPRIEMAFLSDNFLVTAILMAMLFGYGGVAIHAVTKMLSEYLKEDKSELAEINKFFHLTFSHNLAFAGISLASLGLVLLEINHVSRGPLGLWNGVVRGLMLGGSFWLATYNYARYTGERYQGRWNDLKVTFGVVWLAFALIIYLVEKLNVGFSEYDLLLPMLLSFSIMVGVSLVLVVRRLKRGGWKISWKRRWHAEQS